MKRNKFFIGDFVVLVIDPTGSDAWREGYIKNISTNLKGDILYGIECDVVDPEEDRKILHELKDPDSPPPKQRIWFVTENYVFGSRLDMYYWREAALACRIAQLEAELRQVKDLINEEREYARDCGDEA